MRAGKFLVLVGVQPVQSCECVLVMGVLGLALAVTSASPSVGGEDSWVARIRKDHPRLFFNADTWPAVKERALTVCKEHFAEVKKHADGPWADEGGEWALIERPPARPGSSVDVRDWGKQLMAAALAHRVEPSPQRLQRIKDMLWASVDYYHACYAVGQDVNWYSTSRIGWLCAFDWVWHELTPDERREMGASILKHVDDALHKPNIQRRNLAGFQSGYYGADNIAFFAGIVFVNEGIDDARALMCLKTGYNEYQKLLPYRAKLAGDDGGGASPTLGYTLAASGRAEGNFFHAWHAATGEDIARQWPYPALLANYTFWNWLPGDHEFGYGDTDHKDNKMPKGWLYTHMSHIMHFYGQSQPELAALAAWVRERAGGRFPVTEIPMYAYLCTNTEKAPRTLRPKRLPSARHFENMGQVFMRSGSGDQDTYALFACGANVPIQYDATHFTLYKMGFLALDSGSRTGDTPSLANYFGQTIAHNCVLIKMPGEPPSPYWGGAVYAQAGGQNKRIGSKLIAFETTPEFTYVAGDATPVYSEQKCKLMVRQFVFIPPDHFVVFDRVTPTQPEFAKTWLLHHANEPAVAGRTWRSDQDRGRLFCRTLLPEDAVLEKVGGPGREFLVEGVNYPLTAGPSKEMVERGHRIAKLDYKEVPELMGRWRMEVRPGSPRTDDVFLHLIQVGDQKRDRMSDAEVSTPPGLAEVTFAVADGTVTLSFATTGRPGGRIRIVKGPHVLVDRDLASAVMPQKGLK